MPIYTFKCDCGDMDRKLLKAGEAPEFLHCVCGGLMVRAPQAPSTKAVETLDNGLMYRSLERPADAQRLFKERSKLPREKE